MDVDELHAAQAARWRAADPLLPAPDAPRPDPVRAPGGAGWLRRLDPDPQSMVATWSAARMHRLDAHVAGDDPAAALGALLDLVDPDLGPVGDRDSAVEVFWPSRDTAPVLALNRRGFGAATVVAVRRTGGPGAPTPPGVRIRPLEPDDVDAATRMHLGIVRYDAQFGAVGERPSTEARMREELTGRADHPEPTAWVAELDGRPVGLCEVDPPDRACWLAPLCADGPIGYLSSMFVDPAVRGGGLGAALHAHADAALRAAGATRTLLHHSPPNPLSTPFWYGQGYRPLWTSWRRRPARAR
ncbi:GNAT family N-acetyltransferase [Pseudonocardia humida]|uniref:GNAT family N-acetyltransferase n=1 Tax=Pseudonocardia humida TaxID=2800819 RepID=A0ABT0ZU76_9PSEU|nr:GNAT family N-acetyltransferase [Pseudonocardia humida]MCO1654259.1 GNAT family N-acetyltransferase [Pseudonocardia humida]